MPSSIPYDPSLVLANVVDTAALKTLQQISEAAEPADSAQNNLNALISMRRSLDMTRNELTNLGIDTTKCNESLTELNKKITEAANEYVTKKIEAEEQIKEYRASMKGVSSQAESPVDYTATQIKTMPLSADSMNMDVQYFSMDSNMQDSSSYASTISTFVAASTSWMGAKASSEMSAAAEKQASRQASTKSLSGTLVLSVSCTHKNASLLAPFVLNPDKAIGVWNQLFPSNKLDPTSRKDMVEATKADDDPNADYYSIISGTTFGSSFVGMVHVLNNTDTTVSETMTSAATSLQAQMEIGSWFAERSGGFGVSGTFADDVKNLLSSQNVTTHVTLISMGVIPSMVASEVKLGVQAFAKFDPKSTMEAVAQLQNSTVQGQTSVQSSAQAARTGQQMVSMQNSQVKAALEGLSEIDDGHNKMLDINSLMSALDDYLKKAAEGNSGVPLTYYLKQITKKMLAQAWTAKYYPQYNGIRHDDSAGPAPPAPE